MVENWHGHNAVIGWGGKKQCMRSKNKRKIEKGEIEVSFYSATFYLICRNIINKVIQQIMQTYFIKCLPSAFVSFNPNNNLNCLSSFQIDENMSTS